ncbi:EpsG family protein [Consotaella aegiceratis]|uniref:EpsG family protein n=1 Tax=Consotaella aegiceratis TaxID=3097961 RepID=UPI002F40EE72
MLPYWILFAVPAFAATAERGRWRRRGAAPTPGWIVFGVLLTLFIGLRYEVGGDWSSYLLHLQSASHTSFSDIWEGGDPGYVLVNWLVGQLGWGVWAVNLVCAAIFTCGLIVFARNQPRPWLALVVAVPYLVIVVGMGYTRQAVAVGLAMLGLTALARGSVLNFVLWVALAACFHKTAVAIVPIAILAGTERRLWTAVWVAASGIILYYLFLSESVDRFMVNYVEAQYESQGATIRVMMNAIPAVVFLIYRKRLATNPRELKLWTYFSLLALGFVPLLVVSSSSTAVDRMALYLIPIQLFVLSRIPGRVGGKGNSRLMAMAVLSYSASVQFVWMVFASHAHAWLPYQFYI